MQTRIHSLDCISKYRIADSIFYNGDHRYSLRSQMCSVFAGNNFAILFWWQRGIIYYLEVVNFIRFGFFQNYSTFSNNLKQIPRFCLEHIRFPNCLLNNVVYFRSFINFLRRVAHRNISNQLSI